MQAEYKTDAQRAHAPDALRGFATLTMVLIGVIPSYHLYNPDPCFWQKKKMNRPVNQQRSKPDDCLCRLCQSVMTADDAHQARKCICRHSPTPWPGVLRDFFYTVLPALIVQYLTRRKFVWRT
jgi:hypothetical protein